MMKRKIQLPELLPGAVVVDLDGTFYDAPFGWETLVKLGWTEYFKLCDSFPFDEDVFREVCFFSMGGMRIFFISEQPECLRRVVERGLVNFSDFEPWQLILKPEDCQLSSPRFMMSELQKIYETHEIYIIIQSISLKKLCKEAGFKRLYPVNPKNNFNYPEPVALCAVPPDYSEGHGRARNWEVAGNLSSLCRNQAKRLRTSNSEPPYKDETHVRIQISCL